MIKCNICLPLLISFPSQLDIGIDSLLKITLNLGIKQLLISSPNKHILKIYLSLLHLWNVLLVLCPIRGDDMRTYLLLAPWQYLLLLSILLLVHLLTVIVLVRLVLLLWLLFLHLSLWLFHLVELLQVVVLGVLLLW